MFLDDSLIDQYFPYLKGIFPKKFNEFHQMYVMLLLVIMKFIQLNEFHNDQHQLCQYNM